MFNIGISLPPGPVVNVATTSGRGFTPEELAARCAERSISVSDSAPQVIRDQALAYRNTIAQVVAQYLKQAVINDRVTVYNALVDAGHPQLAEAIKKL